MFKQALRRILNFLDHNNNHKIRLEDFIDIMDEHNVELDPEEVGNRVKRIGDYDFGVKKAPYSRINQFKGNIF